MMMNINENEQVVVVELDEEELDEISGGRQVQSLGHSVYIRTGAGPDYGIIGRVKNGELLAYAGKIQKGSDGCKWYQVHWNGTYGWICGKYAKLL